MVSYLKSFLIILIEYFDKRCGVVRNAHPALRLGELILTDYIIDLQFSQHSRYRFTHCRWCWADGHAHFTQ